mgnify:FL=1
MFGLELLPRYLKLLRKVAQLSRKFEALAISFKEFQILGLQLLFGFLPLLF